MPSHNHTLPRGFTLIELLVVVFIISLTAGILLINISLGTTEDKIKQEAIRFQSLLRFSHEQSVIRAEEYGIRFHKTGYRFMTLEDELWVEMSTDRHLVAKELEDNMEFELYIEDIDVVLNDTEDEAHLIKEEQAELEEKKDNEIKKEQKIKPQIFLLSSGELSPDFISRIRIPGEDIYFDLQGTLNGEYKLTRSDE
jgi:general secretion pathway protein H